MLHIFWGCIDAISSGSRPLLRNNFVYPTLSVGLLLVCMLEEFKDLIAGANITGLNSRHEIAPVA